MKKKERKGKKEGRREEDRKKTASGRGSDFTNKLVKGRERKTER